MCVASCNLFYPRSGGWRRPGIDPRADRRDYRISNKATHPKGNPRRKWVFWEHKAALKAGARACKSGGFVPLTVTTIEWFRYKHLYRIFQPGSSPMPEFPAKCGVPGGRFI